MAARRVLARCLQPAPTGPGSTGTFELPEELLSEQVQRLALFCMIAAALWGVGLVMDLFLLSVATGAPRNWRSITLEFFGGFASLVVALYAATSSASTQRKRDVGLALMIVTAVILALLTTWAVPPPPFSPDIVYVSWISVLILVYSMVAPHTPRRMLAAGLVAASMEPLALWLADYRGQYEATVMGLVILSWPNYACAAIAMLPSRVLHRLGRRLHEAQDLGSYTLVEPLGKGGMGEVWRAEHRLLARDAAIKLVRPELLGARTEAEAQLLLHRFEREAQATAALSSPHSIQLFDFGSTNDGSFYYVMELLVGRDIESLVREFGPMPADRTVFLLRQACHSLADAHARGLVHRDVKPANIYVCRMGLEYDFVKVLDFGLVKFKGHAKDMETLATMDHTTSGTPAYMAPEAILGDTEVDRRTDVYALGCVAYFMLTGQLVFAADTPMKMFMQHLQATPVPPSQRTELPIPPELDAFVLACLEKDPNKRPQSAWELFRMASSCCNADFGRRWQLEDAQAWWETHLPEHTHDLNVDWRSRETRSAVPS